MTSDELGKMKGAPGLYLCSQGLIVASIGGKIYGMVADNHLSDEGWGEHMHVERCLLVGRIGRVKDAQD